MIKKQYDILLGNKKIGTSKLEKADAAMGVVFGKIDFMEILSGYDFLRSYCLEHKIKFTEISEERLIEIFDLATLKVVDKNGNEIKGMNNSIGGMDSDQFDITILGIAYPFYEQEFPDHVKAYNEMFK